MNTWRLEREQVLGVIAVTTLFLWAIAAVCLFLLHLPLIPMQLSLSQGLLGLALGLGISGVSYVLYRYIKPFRDSADEKFWLVVAPLTYQDLVWLGVLPGLSEEMLFRGILLPALGSNWFGVVTSSVIFGILHLSQPRFCLYVFCVICIGMIFAIMTLTTGSTLTATVAHITTNILSAWLWKLYLSKPAN
ncbi:MAG: CPBP family intramembrane glutamic endopeptidase [Pseudanabaenaceae cyanobacterium SKYGB_i_bin29]|nr:CPBP family intramembrane metalloprotease [Pseudanabaenaceae cyanobacterium SKYG29]MDW8420833.1 CPBP family intramembrane glutamic endopeptidase [Pseudanabaenaceae cyanobacterium SKYGB_i_bin29]